MRSIIPKILLPVSEKSLSRRCSISNRTISCDPPPKFFRLTPGQEVRLRYAYFIKCIDFVKDADGNVIELHCTYDPTTRGGDAPDGRKVKSTIHWVSAGQACPAEVRLYDRLFTEPDPDKVTHEGLDYLSNLNPSSLEVLNGAFVEPSLADAIPGERFQFERQGYFCIDADSGPGNLVINRTVALKDAWAKIEKGQTG